MLDYNVDERTNLIESEDEEDLNIAEKRPPPYPKSVFFIISNEFCERFSYYGMRTILTIYLVQILLYSEDDATVLYHAFSVACYFTPVLGAIISDSWLGKFKTIFYISIIYAAGNVLISIGAVPQNLTNMNILSMIGLGLIALGTGGIKPCVSAFGGDQFKSGQEIQRERFFSLFYMSINLGSTISTFITPMLRNDVKCFGSQSCFSLAFGVPAVLMVLSLVIFLLGRPLYKINPPEGNVLSKVVKCICHAIVRKVQGKGKNKDHWLEYADDKYDPTFIKEVQTVLHILLLFVPLPLFWALFDQQGSRWTLQATRMSGKMFGWTMQPDQMQVVNPFLIIILIPTFQYVVYPTLNKCNLLKKPLQRITIGGLIAALSFVCAGILEMSLEKNNPVWPERGYSNMVIINNSPCHVEISGTLNKTLEKYEDANLNNIKLGTSNSWILSTKNCLKNTRNGEFEFNSTFPIESIMITVRDGKLTAMKFEDTFESSVNGTAKFRVFYNFKEDFSKNRSKLIFSSSKHSESIFSEHGQFNATKYFYVPSELYKLDVSTDTTNKLIKEIELGEGGNYIISLFQDPDNLNITAKAHVVVKANTILLLWQIPQYLLITVGEIMFSITGLEFSYSQAPKSMKSVMQAIWLLTVSFGNLIILLIAESRIFNKQSLEFFLFACLMVVDMFIFAIMASFYKYSKVHEESSSGSEKDITEKAPPPYDEGFQRKGIRNNAFDEDTKF